MLTGDRQPNASVVTVATADVENRKIRRSCPQICLFAQVFSGQNIGCCKQENGELLFLWMCISNKPLLKHILVTSPCLSKHASHRGTTSLVKKQKKNRQMIFYKRIWSFLVKTSYKEVKWNKMLELWKITESILDFEQIKRRTLFIYFGIAQLLHLWAASVIPTHLKWPIT